MNKVHRDNGILIKTNIATNKIKFLWKNVNSSGVNVMISETCSAIKLEIIISEILTQITASLTGKMIFRSSANFLRKIGENRRNLAKIAEIWRKSPKFGENRRNLAKIAETCQK
jgi:indole-3-glycerol phosphate synthase